MNAGRIFEKLLWALMVVDFIGAIVCSILGNDIACGMYMICFTMLLIELSRRTR